MNYLKKIEKTVSSFQLSRRNYGAPLQTPHKPGVNTAKNGVLFSLFPAFARRRKMAPRENKRGGRGGESTPFFAVGLGGLASGCQLGWPVQLTTSASLSETAKQRRPTLLPTSFPRRLKLFSVLKLSLLARLAETARPTLVDIRNAALKSLVEGARKAAQKGRVPNQEEGYGGGVSRLEGICRRCRRPSRSALRRRRPWS